jgi:hypothetical protein
MVVQARCLSQATIAAALMLRATPLTTLRQTYQQAFLLLARCLLVTIKMLKMDSEKLIAQVLQIKTVLLSLVMTGQWTYTKTLSLILA